MIRLAYPGSPDRLNGPEDTSHIEQNLAIAQNGYRHYIKHGSLLETGASPANTTAASRSNASAGTTGAQTSGASKGLSVKKQLLLLPLVIAGIVVLAIAYVAAKDALFSDKSDESAAPAQSAAEAPADPGASNGGATGATGGDTAGGLTPADHAPEPIASFVRACTDYEAVFSYYGADSAPAPQAMGTNCSVDTTKAPDVGYVVFTDDPAATAAVRDGKPVLDAVEIPAESTRGSTFKAQRVESLITVAEILPEDQGIVEYMIKNDDPEVAKKALVDLGVAK